MPSFFGEVQVVDDVVAAFYDVVVDAAPASIALSGGHTAHQCYERLVLAPVDWSGTEVFIGDERWVPTSDPESNEGMARIALLDRAQPAAIHSMYGAGETIEAAADAYDALVRESPPIALCHLGLGDDGHTASLFPGNTSLNERDRMVVATGDDLHPYPRLTFTYPAIERCSLVVVTVAGDDKRDAFARVRAGEDFPATYVRAKRVLWLADEAAMG
jgi:6-phosphogluconolactonase